VDFKEGMLMDDIALPELGPPAITSLFLTIRLVRTFGPDETKKAEREQRAMEEARRYEAQLHNESRRM